MWKHQAFSIHHPVTWAWRGGVTHDLTCVGPEIWGVQGLEGVHCPVLVSVVGGRIYVTINSNLTLIRINERFINIVLDFLGNVPS